MKKLQLLIVMIFLIADFMFAQLASDYYPLHIGNYWIQHADSISFEYQPTTFRKEIEAIDLIFGEEYFRMSQTRTTDDGSSESTWYSWVREDSTGILLGGFGDISIVESATIFNPPFLWIPNEIVNVGHTWEFNAPEMGGHFFFGVGGISDTVEVAAGTFNDCIRIHGLVVNAIGDSTQMSLTHYAGGIGEVSNFVYIVSSEFYELELIEYYVQLPVDVKNSSIIPTRFSLQPNYPNPFNPTTTISYALPEKSTVKLIVFDIRGQEVIRLQDAEKAPGIYEAQWNGIDQAGNQVSTGVYFARLAAGDFSQTIKMVYLR